MSSPQQYNTKFGTLYNEDCIEALNKIPDESIDLVFADPPFNLNKNYNNLVNDNLTQDEYLRWCYSWVKLTINKLKEGGSLFLWNIPKWNSYLSAYINTRLVFRHWISVQFKVSMPIKGRLYPAHYSLLYYIKGEKPNTFKPDRLPLETCHSCHEELKDYGGYKNKLNSSGLSLSDVWSDIYPVRHKKYKNRLPNELPIKLLDRIIEMSSVEGDTILDIFSGSGTALVTAELKKRNWIGIEIGDIKPIRDRFENINSDLEILEKIRMDYNSLFTSDIRDMRMGKGIWVNEE